MTTSSLSLASLPGSLPATFAVRTRDTLFSNLMVVRSASGTGLNFGLRAAAMSLSRSCPAAFMSFLAAASVAQAFSWMRGSSSAGSSNCSPPQEDCTTCQG
jgi:hypothetical protein